MTMLAEDRFTPESDWCPHPERWHSPDVQGTEIEVSMLLAALVRATQPEFVVETGAYHGQTSALIAEALTQNGHGSMVAIEKNSIAATVARLHVGSPSPCMIVEGNSTIWRPPVALGPIDFLFLDGHLSRMAEWRHLHPFLRPGALAVFHDSRPGRGVLGKALRDQIEEEIVDRQLGKAIDLRTPRGLTIIEVL